MVFLFRVHALGLLLILGSTVASVGQAVQTISLDSTKLVTVVDVLFEGNKRTRAQILYRELTFKPGEELYLSNLRAAMEQSQSNLMNLALFNFIETEMIVVADNQVMVLFTFQERWYIYPAPIFQIAETNFNTWWENRELRWLNYGVSVKHDNFRGLNHKFSVIARFGYTKRFSAQYALPNLNRKQTLGLELAAGFYENNELVWNTLNNERLFYNNPEDKARRWWEYRAGITYRENIFTRHRLNVSLQQVRVNDTIPLLNPNYLRGSDNRTQFMRVNYMLSHDTRDYQRYPLKGLYFYLFLQQEGFGFEGNDGLNMFTTMLSYRHHHQIDDRWFVAHAITGKVNWSEPPYYLVNALGYNHVVRGYELFIIDGPRFALLQSNLKYQLLKPKTFTIPFVPPQFSQTFVSLYANLFFDAGYVHGPLYADANSLVNTYLYSVGVGLDLVTYYDKVMRVEGSLNGLGRGAVFVEFKQAF